MLLHSNSKQFPSYFDVQLSKPVKTVRIAPRTEEVGSTDLTGLLIVFLGLPCPLHVSIQVAQTTKTDHQHMRLGKVLDTQSIGN